MILDWLLDRVPAVRLADALRRRGIKNGRYAAYRSNPCAEVPLPTSDFPVRPGYFQPLAPEPARRDTPVREYVFPNHAVMPTKERVFDDLDLARGKVPYRSAEWYAIREKLVASLKSPGRAFVSKHSNCYGCNEDDRGFVTVVGCPVHDNEEYRAFRARTEKDSELARKMQDLLVETNKTFGYGDGVSGE